MAGPRKHSGPERHRSVDATGAPIPTGWAELADGIGSTAWGSVATGSEVPFDHNNMGATETLDFATDGTWHRGNLDMACVITVVGFTVDEGLVCLVELTGTGAITWDADVDFGGADDQPNASGYTAFVLYSSAGDADIKGAKVGGSPLTVEDEGTPLTTAATALDFVGAGVTASGTGSTKTITIPGGTVTGADLVALGVVGPLLIGDDHSTPIVFADLLLTEDGDDFLYGDIG